MNKSNPHNPPVDQSKLHVIEKKWYKLLRLVKYFVLSAIILTMLELAYGYWLVSSRWSLLLSNEEMKFYASEVSKAERPPENFMRVYTAIYPNHLKTSLTQQIFINYTSRFFLRQTEIDDKPHCFCDMTYDIQKLQHTELELLDWDGRLQDLEFGFGMEKYTTPEKCFYFVIAHRVPEVIGHLPGKTYGHLKNKGFAEMTDDELIEAILLFRAHARFNRTKNAQKFEETLKKFKRRVEVKDSIIAVQNKL